MILDACELNARRPLSADVCIIGSGPVGLTVLNRLMTTGLSCIVLESGGREWSVSNYEMNAGQNVGLAGDDLTDSRRRAVGGTATAWKVEIAPRIIGARFRPLERDDFEKKEWIPDSGWPITWTDLAQHYARAQELCGLGPLRYDSEYWSAETTSPLLDNELFEPVIFQGGPKNALVTAIATCRDDRTADLVYHATVYAIEPTAGGRRFDVAAADSAGRELRIRSSTVVIASGGLENARLLLAFGANGFPRPSPLVGRFFMEHVHSVTGVLIPAEPSLVERSELHSWHPSGGTPIQYKYRLRPEVQEQERVAAYCAYLRPTPVSELPRHLRARVAESGIDAHSVFAVEVMSEQVPNRDSRLTMSDRALPGLDRRHGGQIDLDWRLADLDLRTLLRGQDLILAALRECELGATIPALDRETILDYGHVWTGHHHMGTTRMAVEPEAGVVDTNCRLHGIPNLYVVGSSVFPTGGFANPTLTAIALADRLAAHIHAIDQRG